MTNISIVPPPRTDEAPWRELARRAPLAALLDLDDTDVPLSISSDDTLDRALLLLLSSLERAGVQVVIVCRRGTSFDRLQRQAPSAWWLSDHETAIDVIRARLPGVHVLAMGCDEQFHALHDGRDLGIAVRSDCGQPSRARLVLRGTTALRAMLWWLVALRSGSAAAERRR